jgi:ribosomal protein S18 acetylase RimI-like enzyme
MAEKIPKLLSGIKIRRARMVDIPQLVDLLGMLFTIETDLSLNEVAQRTGLELLLKDDKQRYVAVAADHALAIGMVTAQLRISTACGGYVARVEDMIISPPYRRKGLGTMLLTAAATWAYSKKAVKLELLADKDNVAGLSFYHANGWKRTNLILLQK